MTSRFPPFAFVELVSPYNKKNITRWLEDMNFMFEWQEQYLTSERSERVRYCSKSEESEEHIHRGYYTVARRYEFYVRVARTISHSFASLTREILFLPLEHKIHIFSPPCNILYLFY